MHASTFATRSTTGHLTESAIVDAKTGASSWTQKNASQNVADRQQNKNKNSNKNRENSAGIHCLHLQVRFVKNNGPLRWCSWWCCCRVGVGGERAAGPALADEEQEAVEKEAEGVKKEQEADGKLETDGTGAEEKARRKTKEKTPNEVIWRLRTT
jgi:hypothetical protein